MVVILPDKKPSGGTTPRKTRFKPSGKPSPVFKPVAPNGKVESPPFNSGQVLSSNLKSPRKVKKSKKKTTKSRITNAYNVQKSKNNTNEAKFKPESRSIGNYLVDETIGQGTFGKVKKGKHLITGIQIAVKILEKNKIVEPADVTRVRREIKILQQVRHENVIRLLEVIDQAKEIYLMMEYVEGGELFDYIVKRTRLPENEASPIFSQIIEGVEYIHKLGVTHRDLKPENILLSKRLNGRWHVKIADFGLSAISEGISGLLLSTACGSPCYAAPEMIAGEKYDGTKSDVWSLGVVLFAMVCGYLPFEDDCTPTLYQKILSADYEIPEFVSPICSDLLDKILNVDPKTRFSTRDITNHEWIKPYEPSSYHDNNHSEGIITDDKKKSEEILQEENGELDEEIIKHLEQIGVSREETIRSMATGNHNTATTSYYLLKEKKSYEIRNNLRPEKLKQVEIGKTNNKNPLPEKLDEQIVENMNNLSTVSVENAEAEKEKDPLNTAPSKHNSFNEKDLQKNINEANARKEQNVKSESKMTQQTVSTKSGQKDSENSRVKTSNLRLATEVKKPTKPSRQGKVTSSSKRQAGNKGNITTTFRGIIKKPNAISAKHSTTLRIAKKVYGAETMKPFRPSGRIAKANRVSAPATAKLRPIVPVNKSNKTKRT